MKLKKQFYYYLCFILILIPYPLLLLFLILVDLYFIGNQGGRTAGES